MVKSALPYGLWGGLALIAFFLIMKLLNLHTQTLIRGVNFLILVPFVVACLNHYSKDSKHSYYLKSLLVGYYTFLVSYILIAAFMFVYLSFIDNTFMELLQEKNAFYVNLSPLSVSLLLLMEGAVMGIIISFVTMQYFKSRTRNVG